MNRINKTILCGLLLCLLGAAGKGYGQEPGTVLWEKETGSTSSRPIIGFDDDIYLGTSGRVLRLNKFDGEILWESPAVGGAVSEISLGVKNGQFFLVGIYYSPEKSKTILFSIDHYGKIIWSYDGLTGIGIYTTISDNGQVIAANGKNVLGINGLTGSLNWEFTLDKDAFESFPMMASENKIFILNRNGDLFQIDTKGNLTNSIKIGGSVYFTTPVMDEYSSIYIGTNWPDNKLKKYSFEFNHQMWAVENIQISSDPIIGTDNDIYVAGRNQKLYSIDSRDGKIRWTKGNIHETGCRLLGADGVLYARNISGEILILNKNDGKEKHAMPGGEFILDEDGIIYINRGSALIAQMGSGPIADSPWPIYGGNLQNTRRRGGGQVIISKQPRINLVESGENALFSVQAKGEWPRTYQWEFNGVPIQGATQPLLTIQNATSKNAGRYRVNITNKHGSVTSYHGVLKVVPPGAPQIFADGKEVVDSVVKGEKAEITLSTSFEDGLIFYTLDGSEPSFESTLYDGSFTVSKTTGIRAIAYDENFSPAEAYPVFINIVPNYDLNVSIEGQGTIVKDPNDGPYMQDSVVKLKAIPEEGWRFKGWSGALKSSFEEGSVVMASGKSVTAVFQAIPKYTLNTSTAGGGVISGNVGSPYYPGTEVTLVARASAGWVFMGWSGDVNGKKSKAELTMIRSKEVRAHFGTTLETTATGNGGLLIAPPEGPYPYGSTVTINPVPDAGYYLGVWGQDAAGMPKEPIEYEITKANPKITALFVPLKENRFTVTTLATAGGSVVSNPNSNAYVNGQQVTLTATPEPGYSFVRWTGDIESTDNPLVTLADANKTVTAEFRRNVIAPVTLIINAKNGIVTRNPSDELYEKGTLVELLAQPNPGYTFTGWAGALGGTASRTTLFLDGDKEVTANFKASYQLATETRGPGSVLTTPSSTTFIDGDEVILTASPAEGYGFVGWTGDLESTDQQTSLVMDSNKRVIAHFAQLDTLTTWTRGEGTITRSPDKDSYFPGESVTLTATPGDGFEFVSWDGQASGTANPTTITMDRAMSVAAYFKDIKAPTVTIDSPASQETGDETFNLSGTVTDNGKIKSLVWLWKGNEMGELELTEGKFSLEDQKLVGGANAITVIATDRSGNEGKAMSTPTWVPNRSIRIAVATEQQEGNRIEVPIEINSKGDVGGMGFVLNYNHSYLMDPVLTWSSAAGGSINLVNEDVAGELRGTFSLGGTSLPAGEQLIGTVSFRARSVPENLETAIGLMDISVSDPAGAIFESGTDVVSGQARVLVRGITGDNNANDRLDVGDATRIQRLLVRMDIARAWDVAGNDLNGNGALDPGDVTKVLRAVVGIDPQPNRNRAIAKMGGDDDEVETVLLFLKEKTANTVTVQVQLKDMQSTIAGANFQLEYPTELLRLKDRSSHSAGEMVAKNAAAIWNVSPAQTDYSKQDGTLAMAVSSPEPWTVKNGVLAELSFDVQGGADLNKAVLSLSEVEVTPDGFDNRMLDGVEINVGSEGDVKQPNAPVLRDITTAPLSFRFDTEPNRDYSIEGSADLKAWEVLEQFKSTKRSHQFTDTRKAFFQHQYYRVTVE